LHGDLFLINNKFILFLAIFIFGGTKDSASLINMIWCNLWIKAKASWNSYS